MVRAHDLENNAVIARALIVIEAADRVIAERQEQEQSRHSSLWHFLFRRRNNRINPVE